VCSSGRDPAETIAAFEDAARLSNRASLYLVMLAYALASGGRDAEARTLLSELAVRGEAEFVWPMGLAMAYGALGDESTALEHLERAYDERVGWMQLMAREPMLDMLQHTPKYKELARRIGPAESLPA